MTYLRLNHHEPDDDALEKIPDAENQIHLPADLIERDRKTKRVDAGRDLGDDAQECETLCTSLVSQDLSGIERLPENRWSIRSSSDSRKSATHIAVHPYEKTTMKR